MKHSQTMNHFQNAKVLLLKAAILTENAKISQAIELIDQLIDSKHASSKEKSMSELHEKIDRIEYLIEKQNAKKVEREITSQSNTSQILINKSQTQENIKTMNNRSKMSVESKKEKNQSKTSFKSLSNSQEN